MSFAAEIREPLDNREARDCEYQSTVSQLPG